MTNGFLSLAEVDRRIARLNDDLLTGMRAVLKRMATLDEAEVELARLKDLRKEMTADV